jgi:hypothetical protein
LVEEKKLVTWQTILLLIFKKINIKQKTWMMMVIHFLVNKKKFPKKCSSCSSKSAWMAPSFWSYTFIREKSFQNQRRPRYENLFSKMYLVSFCLKASCKSQ